MVHVGGRSSPLSCAVFLPPLLSQAFLLLITGRCCCSCQPPCLFTVHMGSGSSLLSCGVFLPPPLSSFATLTCFPVPGCWVCAPAPARALLPARLVYLQSRERFPSPNLQHSVRPTLFPVYLYCSYCLLLGFSFFPGWRSVCPGRALLLWPRLVCGSTTVPQSSPGLRLPKPSGHRRLAAGGPSLFLCLT
jgi:hypothetical protein